MKPGAATVVGDRGDPVADELVARATGLPGLRRRTPWRRDSSPGDTSSATTIPWLRIERNLGAAARARSRADRRSRGGCSGGASSRRDGGDGAGTRSTSSSGAAIAMAAGPCSARARCSCALAGAPLLHHVLARRRAGAATARIFVVGDQARITRDVGGRTARSRARPSSVLEQARHVLREHLDGVRRGSGRRRRTADPTRQCCSCPATSRS